MSKPDWGEPALCTDLIRFNKVLRALEDLMAFGPSGLNAVLHFPGKDQKQSDQGSDLLTCLETFYGSVV